MEYVALYTVVGKLLEKNKNKSICPTFSEDNGERISTLLYIFIVKLKTYGELLVANPA